MEKTPQNKNRNLHHLGQRGGSALRHVESQSSLYHKGDSQALDIYATMTLEDHRSRDKDDVLQKLFPKQIKYLKNRQKS